MFLKYISIHFQSDKFFTVNVNIWVSVHTLSYGVDNKQLTRLYEMINLGFKSACKASHE